MATPRRSGPPLHLRVSERRVTRTAKNGKVDVFAARFEGKRLNAPDDIVVRRTETFTSPTRHSAISRTRASWISTASFTSTPEANWTPSRDGRPAPPRSRALAQRPHAVRRRCGRAKHSRVRISGRQRHSLNERRLRREKSNGVPGGLRTDEKGNLYVAAKNVYVYSPRGELLKDIQLAQTPSNLRSATPIFPLST